MPASMNNQFNFKRLLKDLTSMLFCTLVLTSNVYAQIRIHNNSTLRAKGQIAINVSLTNTSTNTNLNEANILLAGANQQVSTNQETIVANLEINHNSVSTVSGNWRITNSLILVNGILRVNNNAKLLYTGTGVIEGNTNSYVEGYFQQTGSGRKFFPIGAGGFYLPAVLEDVPPNTIESGMRVVAGDAQLILPPEINSAVTNHYWELSAAVATPVSLSISNAGTGSIDDFVVLQAGAPQSLALPLPTIASTDFIITSNNISQPLLAIGKRSEFSLVIHDMITPYIKDEINDKLFIENIEKTTSNKVVLLDRWGVKVNEWKNYSNEITYDFSTLSPGNYICIVEFVSADGTKGLQKGMVTVLRTK